MPRYIVDVGVTRLYRVIVEDAPSQMDAERDVRTQWTTAYHLTAVPIDRGEPDPITSVLAAPWRDRANFLVEHTREAAQTPRPRTTIADEA